MPYGWAFALHAPKAGGLRRRPFYQFEIRGGSRSGVVSLDPFTGELRNTPWRPGVYELTARVRDDEANIAGASRPLRIRVAGR